MKWLNRHEWIDMKKLKKLSFLRFCVINYLMMMWLTYIIWNEALTTVSRTFCRPHLQKVQKKSRQFLTISMWSWWRCGRQMKRSSRYSRAHTLSTSWSTSSSKIGPNPSVFDDFLANRALARVSCTFCRPHLQKAQKSCQFSDGSYVKSSSHYSLVRILPASSSKSGKNVIFLRFLCGIELWLQSRATFLSTTFRIEARNRRHRHPPATTTDSHFTGKYTWCCAQDGFQPWIHKFPMAHTSQLLGQGGNLCRGCVLVPQTVCRWEVHHIHVIRTGWTTCLWHWFF